MKAASRALRALVVLAALAPCALASPARADDASQDLAPGWDVSVRLGFVLHAYAGEQRTTAGGAGLAATRWVGSWFGVRAGYDVVGTRRGVADVYALEIDHRLAADALFRTEVADPITLFAGVGPALVIEERHHFAFGDTVSLAVAYPAAHLTAGVEAAFGAVAVRFSADAWLHARGVDPGGSLAVVFTWPDP